MAQLYKMAIDDFLVLHSDQSVEQARDIIELIRPMRLIVNKWSRDLKRGIYYLYPLEKFWNLLYSSKNGDMPIEELSIDECYAVPVINDYENPISLPSKFIIKERDVIIGFYDERAYVASHQRNLDFDGYRKEVSTGVWSGLPSRSATRTIGPKDISNPMVSGTLNADFPNKVALGETNSLLVWLDREIKTKDSQYLEISLGTDLDIVVQALKGFVIVDQREDSIKVTNEDRSERRRFKLRSTEIGTGLIIINCFNGSQPLGTIKLTPDIVAANYEGLREDRESVNLVPLLEEKSQPDLTLCIQEMNNYGKSNISFKLKANRSKVNLGEKWKSFGDKTIQIDPVEYFKNFFNEIKNLSFDTPKDQEKSATILALKGASLAENLLPQDLHELLWSLRCKNLSIQILSNEPWIPWELLNLQGNVNGQPGEVFLSDAFVVTRWFPDIGSLHNLSLKNMAVISPKDSHLPSAPHERDFLLSLSKNKLNVSEIPATFTDVEAALCQGEFDAWHFTGHGIFESSDPNRSVIQLEDSEELRPEYISGRAKNCGRTRPLVFLNACQSGQEALSLTGIGGWARTFARAGASSFIGTLWSIDDDAAFAFAKDFYNGLLTGSSVGQSAKNAKLNLQKSNNLNGLAYTVFASPEARIVP
ncbi:MAG: CHAT domain-containing protein [Methanotrichaceae archaeon]